MTHHANLWMLGWGKTEPELQCHVPSLRGFRGILGSGVGRYGFWVVRLGRRGTSWTQQLTAPILTSGQKLSPPVLNP
jgi:hypothetical protein